MADSQLELIQELRDLAKSYGPSWDNGPPVNPDRAAAYTHAADKLEALTSYLAIKSATLGVTRTTLLGIVGASMARADQTHGLNYSSLYAAHHMAYHVGQFFGHMDDEARAHDLLRVATWAILTLMKLDPRPDVDPPGTYELSHGPDPVVE